MVCSGYSTNFQLYSCFSRRVCSIQSFFVQFRRSVLLECFANRRREFDFRHPLGAMSNQLKARKWSNDPHRIYNGPKVQYMVKERFRDMAQCLHDLEKDKEFNKFGIVGVIPPDGSAPETFDLLNEGATAFGAIQFQPALGEYADQRLYKWARHVTFIENTFVRGEYSWDEFAHKAKLSGDFFPPAKDVDEAEELLWERLKNIEAEVGADPPPSAKMYPFTIDGSLMKIKLGPENEVSENQFL